MTTQERIKADAEVYALPMVWVNQNPKGEEQLFYEYISSTSYIAGATAESEFTKKAMTLLKIIVSRFQGAAEMADQDYDKGLMTKCRNLIEQWRRKEVEPTNDKCRCIQPNWNAFTGKCLTCGKP